MRPLLALALATSLVTGCSSLRSNTLAQPTSGSHQSGTPRTAFTVKETFVTDQIPGEELDSLAVWQGPRGEHWLIASGKSGHRLTVMDADTGRKLQVNGARGQAPGQFNRPNGLAVSGNLLFVVERDNHRVQALRLPDFTPAGIIGADLLRSPYGIWLHERGDGTLDAYVTDSFMYGERYDIVPPLEELSQRVRRFRLDTRGEAVLTESAHSFGDTTEAGGLQRVESLAGDPDNDRLLVADEAFAPRRRSNLREYTLDGRYTGHSLPEDSFDAEAEGVVLWTCPGGGGYWIAVDQLSPLTRFHVFDRGNLQLVGTWQGAVTANTDGITIETRATPTFPGGALYAVHRDVAVTAFDLRDVIETLDLDRTCAP